MSGYVASLLVILESLLRTGWRLQAWTGVAGVGVSAAASLLALISAEGGTVAGFDWLPSIGVKFALRVDLVSGIMGLLVAVISFLIAVYSVEYIGEWGAARYWVFYTFFVASMLLLVYADDLVTFFIGWEGTGLSSWALIGFYYDEREDAWVGDPGRRRLGVPMWFTPTHSALRAIAFTRLGDIAMLIGMGVAYAALGAVSLTILAEKGPLLAALVKGAGIIPLWLILFYMGALAKSAQFPFHEWLVTAMTGPTSVSALIHAATMVKAGVYYALRITPVIAPFLAAHALGAEAYSGLAWLSLITAFMTATMALVARELKLILAYSTASQLSYMLAAVFAAASHNDVGEGVLGGLAHLLSHAVFKASLFLVAGALIHELHSRYIDHMGGLKRFMPLSFISFMLASLSLAAIPPFSGWWSKDEAIEAISAMGHLASGVALVTALLTAAYTGRMLFLVFFNGYRGHVAHPHEPSWIMVAPYLVLGVASLAMGLTWPWIKTFLIHAVGVEAVKASPPIVLAGTIASVAGMGGTIAYYARKTGLPEASVLRAPTGVVAGFLYDRWLINSLIYRLIVYPGRNAAIALRRIDSAVDEAIHVFLPRIGVSMSAIVRRLQTGDVRDYLSYFMVGVILTALISALVVKLTG